MPKKPREVYPREVPKPHVYCQKCGQHQPGCMYENCRQCLDCDYGPGEGRHEVLCQKHRQKIRLECRRN